MMMVWVDEEEARLASENVLVMNKRRAMTHPQKDLWSFFSLVLCFCATLPFNIQSMNNNI